MGAGSMLDYCLDYGVLFCLEIHKVVSTSEVHHSNPAVPFDRRLPHTVPHPRRC